MGKTHSTAAHCPLTVSQASYIQAIRRTPIFLPNFGGEGASYSPKNTVVYIHLRRRGMIDYKSLL